MSRKASTSSDTEDTQDAAASTSFGLTRPAAQLFKRAKNLRMTKAPLFDITNSDCPEGRIPPKLLLARGDSLKYSRSRSKSYEVGSNSDTILADVSDDANRVYWKVCIGTYMVHYMKALGILGDEWDLNTLWRIRKFPTGYELYAKQRLAGKRTPDHYLFGFDRHGERVIMFDSPYVFVLHGVALACGSTRYCPCSVCDEDAKQTDIRKMLLAIAPNVNIPGVVTFRKNVRTRPEKPPVELEQSIKSEPEEADATIKIEPEEADAGNQDEEMRSL